MTNATQAVRHGITDVVVVSHGVTIRALLMMWLHLTPGRFVIWFVLSTMTWLILLAQSGSNSSRIRKTVRFVSSKSAWTAASSMADTNISARTCSSRSDTAAKQCTFEVKTKEKTTNKKMQMILMFWRKRKLRLRLFNALLLLSSVVFLCFAVRWRREAAAVRDALDACAQRPVIGDGGEASLQQQQQHVQSATTVDFNCDALPPSEARRACYALAVDHLTTLLAERSAAVDRAQRQLVRVGS